MWRQRSETGLLTGQESLEPAAYAGVLFRLTSGPLDPMVTTVIGIGEGAGA